MQIGSWGTPEFGITEQLSNLLGQGRTAQGGSNLFSNIGWAPTAQVPNNQGGFNPVQGPGLGWNGQQDIFRGNNTLGATTTQPPAGGNPPSGGSPGGGGGGGNGFIGPQQPSGPSPEELARQKYENQMRSSIGSGWDAYTSQLNDMLNTGLPGQRGGQEQIAQGAYQQGINQLGTQKTASEQSVQNQQAKSLNDLTGNIRNMFQAGNVYLGARGAGDSSAANQYAYGITKMGTRARGDIQTQASDRMNQIGDIYNSEVNKLEGEKQTRMGQIADWFNAAQNQIRQSIGQAGAGREKDIQALSTNLYNTALQAMQNLQTEQTNRRSTLESWAASNSKSVQELVANMQNVQQMPAYQGMQGGMPQVTPEGNMNAPVGYGTTTNQKRDIFGNIIG